MAETVAVNLRDTAERYASQGWAVHPLRNNLDGFPKVAIVPGWQHLQPDDWKDQPWDEAVGLGIIGGSNSCNLAFIDIDDGELAADVAAYLTRKKRALIAWTARSRIHVYVQEPEPSAYRKGTFVYKGHDATVEFRAQGSYVAAPPSPGYTWLKEDWEPLYGTLQEVWSGIVKGLDIGAPRKSTGQPQAFATAGYPTSWATSVGHGERNDACFYESSCLKDAHVPMEQAWQIMQARINQSYTPPLDWHEMRRTFESAYSRPPSSRVGAVDRGVVDRFAR